MQNPINEILKTSLENINQIVDANKIIGEPIVLPNNILAIPISKVTCGYGVGGSEFNSKNSKKQIQVDTELGNEIFPFGGGSGGGLSISPTALVIIQNEKVKILNVEKNDDFLIKLFDAIKEIVKK